MFRRLLSIRRGCQATRKPPLGRLWHLPSVPGATLVLERGDPLGDPLATRVECERLLQAYRRESAL
jgi:Fe2+ transport system protein FeoA